MVILNGKDHCTIANTIVNENIKKINEKIAEVTVISDSNIFIPVENSKIEIEDITALVYNRITQIYISFKTNTDIDPALASIAVGTLNPDLIKLPRKVIIIGGLKFNAQINRAGAVYLSNVSGVTMPAGKSTNVSGVYINAD